MKDLTNRQPIKGFQVLVINFLSTLTSGNILESFITIIRERLQPRWQTISAYNYQLFSHIMFLLCLTKQPPTSISKGHFS